MGLWIFGKIFGATNSVSGAKTGPLTVSPDGAIMVAGKINASSAASITCTTAGLLNVKSTASTATSAQLEAIKTAVQIMDDWDESDRCKVNVSTNTSAQLTAIKTAVEVIDDVVSTVAAAVKTKGLTVVVSDGTNARRTYGDSNGVQYVQPYTIPSHEDAVNGWSNARIKSHLSACGADVATVTVDGTAEGTADEIIPSTNVSTYRAFTMWVENLGATAFTHVYVYASRDGTNWVCVDTLKNALEIACDTLAATTNGICFSVTDNPGWQYVKCTATVASGSTTATGALSYQM